LKVEAHYDKSYYRTQYVLNRPTNSSFDYLKQVSRQKEEDYFEQSLNQEKKNSEQDRVRVTCFN